MILTRLQAENLIQRLDRNLNMRDQRKNIPYITVAEEIIKISDSGNIIDYDQAEMLIGELDGRLGIRSKDDVIAYMFVTLEILNIAEKSATRYGVN